MSPGPVSDTYHSEFGTGAQAEEFRECLREVHRIVSEVIGAPAVDYRTLPDRDPGPAVTACLSEKDWRFIRYALERAEDSI